MLRTSRRSDAGFTLIETLVATGILVTALAGLAQLFAMSLRMTRDSSHQALALSIAQSKLELLRSMALTYGPGGEPVTHPALEPSPPSTLLQDTSGYVEFVDEEARVIAEESASGGASFTTRWAIMPLDGGPPEAMVIEVCVFRWPAEGQSPGSAQSCLATIRARQP